MNNDSIYIVKLLSAHSTIRINEDIHVYRKEEDAIEGFKRLKEELIEKEDIKGRRFKVVDEADYYEALKYDWEDDSECHYITIKQYTIN